MNEIQESVVTSWPCNAKGCPMAGAIEQSCTKGVWWCAYHLACPEDDQPRVTAVLQTHGKLLRIVNEGRHCIAKMPAEVHAQQWDLLRRRLGNWRADQLDLNNHLFESIECIMDAPTFGAWLTRVETMLGGLVQRAISTPRRRGA